MRSHSAYESKPLLDIVSLGRRGPERRDRLSSAELAHVARTVNRDPEVMIKVLHKGGTGFAALARHLDYIGRDGELSLETDTGERVGGDEGRELLESWDLDLEEARPRKSLDATGARRTPKLAHKLVFSMPAGTPPDKVLAAVRSFAREEFALEHRYAFVMHTDEPHPHVHMVVRAMSEHGKRLNIRKATLRGWRTEFARHLRNLGVRANATERAVRRERRNPVPDGLFRLLERGEVPSRGPGRAGTDRPPPPDVARGVAAAEVAMTAAWFDVAHLLVELGQRDLALRATRLAERASHVRPLPGSERSRGAPRYSLDHRPYPEREFTR
jgi:hypothetical protein